MSTADPTSVAELQAQVSHLAVELDLAKAQLAAYLASNPASSGIQDQLAAFRANMQNIVAQGINQTVSANAQALEKLATTFNLPVNADEQTVLLAMRANEAYRVGIVAQARNLLGTK